MKKTILFLILLISLGCKKKNNREPDHKDYEEKVDCKLDYNLVKKNDSIIASFDMKTTMRARFWWNRWDSMNEPKLKEATTESYRLAIIGDDIKVIRIQKNKKTIKLIEKQQLETLKYPKPEDFFFHYSEKKIKANEWNDFVELINQMNFWTMPVNIDNTVLVNNDSPFLLLEGITPELNSCTKRNYHMVIRETSMDTTIIKKIYELGNK